MIVSANNPTSNGGVFLFLHILSSICCYPKFDPSHSACCKVETQGSFVLLDAFSRPARKNTTDQNLLRQSFIAYIFRSQSARSKRARSKRERKRNPVPIKENFPSPRTCHSLIGCSPSAQLSLRERQNTWWENCPCMCADYVYHLEHSCQCHLIMANVRAAPHTWVTNSIGLIPVLGW